MKRKLFSMALVCALLLGLCVPALADADDTVYIDDAEGLFALAERCSYDAWSQGKTVVLRRDVSLGGVDFAPIPSFGGTFEGGGHTISGVNVVGGVSPAGLFGEIAATGVVRALRVEGVVSPAGEGDLVGGVAGINRGRLEGCSFSGTVDAQTRVGGVAGENAASGTILRCEALGGVFGKHMTGGVAGCNHGELSGCVNRAYVNTNTLDPSLSLDKLDLSLPAALDTLTSPETFNTMMDTGGVAGCSDGTIVGCVNHGSVGYPHIGYNVGGVAGRSSGHVASCSNDGSVHGRREVGGIVGVAEPYVRLDLTASSLDTVRRQLNELSRAVDHAADDAQGAGATLSARLTSIHDGVDDAADSAQTLTRRLGDAYDDTISEINRGSAMLDNTVAQLDTVTRDLLAVADRAGEASAALSRAANDLNDGAGGNAFDEASAAADDAARAADILHAGVSELQSGLATIDAALRDRSGLASDVSNISSGVATIRNGADILQNGRGGKSGDRGGAAYYLKDATTRLDNVLADAKDASADVETAALALEDASGALGVALRDLDSLLSYLNAQEKLQFRPLGAEGDAEADALYDSLRGVSDQIELLGRESKASSDALVSDVREINRRFTLLMNTLLDVVEDMEGASLTSVVEDTSDEDVDAVLAGKLLLCRNGGEVSGDIDVGGVAGAMMVFNELDPENDAGSVSDLLRRRYELKCILLDCSSTGTVTGKRDNVGAVCGSATLGVIRGCVGCGSVASEGGDCVGGVAGYADNIVRRCWAKCSISGASWLGGIVGGGKTEGSALRVEDCRSLVDIPVREQYYGAICGGDIGVLRGNRFVSDTLAGVGRVSYAGRAEPVRYDELLAEGGVPQALRSFTLTFRADGSIVRIVPFRYGESFGADAFPNIPAKDGMFACWDRDDLTDLRFDTTVEAVYTPHLTALASAFTRSAGRSAFFVEGAFDDAAAFDAEPAVFDFDAGSEGPWRILRSWRRSILEQWQLTLPDAAEHGLRYLPPEGAAERLEFYTRGADGRWTRLDTGSVGSYLTFAAAGETVALTVVAASTPWWVWALVAVFLLGAAALAAEVLTRRRPKKPPETDEEKARLAQQKKRRKKLRIVLVAAVLALGAAVGAVVTLAPRISNGMGLYRLVRSYAERSDLDMALTITARTKDADLAADLSLYTTTCEGKRVSCARWDDIPIWLCDGALVLENGSAYRADGVLADHSELLTHAAKLYRAVEVSADGANGVKVYHAAAEGEDARQVLRTLLPSMSDLLGTSDAASLDLTVTDGELTSLLVRWSGGESSLTAELRTLDGTFDHTLPSAVRAAIASGDCANAPELGEPLRRLLLAWMATASRETLTADVALRADCGPLLVDETLTWQRSHAYSKTLSCLSRRGGALYYTDDAVCTAGGLAVSRTERTYTDSGRLLRLACRALLLGEASCTDTANGWRCSVSLDADAMAELTALVAPDARALGFAAEGGTVRLDVTGGAPSALTLRCSGAVRVIGADVPASISVRLDFDADAAFRTPAPAVLAALDLTER